MALLVDPGSTITDIANVVGFDSPSAFTRSFRSAAGESPSAYRCRILRDE
jgi:AraC-like DNA-binding protein